MYRYNVDNAVTFTPEDIALFRDSPFAVWMERLTLENPDHGIPPDINSAEPEILAERQDDIVDTLRAEGRDVALIDSDLAEPERRAATLAAMRGGADFIVNGLLALDPLSGTANLLMRTSGYSDLGDFLYVPCETQVRTILESAFRLCFLADLLHNLQGQLPPQLLIIRADSDVVPLQTDDHIYYFQAVKSRFMDTMSNFRKHRMPDPAESSHFGRWSECASEVLKQRAVSAEKRDDEAFDEQASDAETLDGQVSDDEELVDQMSEDDRVMPQLQVANAAGQAQSPYDLDYEDQSGKVSAQQVEAQTMSTGTLKAVPSSTLAEQAQLLTSNSIKVGAGPGRTPNLARFGRSPVTAVKDAPHPEHSRRATDDALQNLQFIGSGPEMPFAEVESLQALDRAESLAETPSPALRNVPPLQDELPDGFSPTVETRTSAQSLPDLDPPEPLLLPPDVVPVQQSAQATEKVISSRNVEVDLASTSSMDLDSAPLPSLKPMVERATTEYEQEGGETSPYKKVEKARAWNEPDDFEPSSDTFSDSLITSRAFEE